MRLFAEVSETTTIVLAVLAFCTSVVFNLGTILGAVAVVMNKMREYNKESDARAETVKEKVASDAKGVKDAVALATEKQNTLLKSQGDEQKAAMERQHLAMNSRLDEFMQEVRNKALLEGEKKGRADEKAESEAKMTKPMPPHD